MSVTFDDQSDTAILKETEQLDPSTNGLGDKLENENEGEKKPQPFSLTLQKPGRSVNMITVIVSRIGPGQRHVDVMTMHSYPELETTLY